jgi:hypothetical protein
MSPDDVQQMLLERHDADWQTQSAARARAVSDDVASLMTSMFEMWSRTNVGWRQAEFNLKAIGSQIDGLEPFQRLQFFGALLPRFGSALTRWWIEERSPFSDPGPTVQFRQAALELLAKEIGPLNCDPRWLWQWAAHIPTLNAAQHAPMFGRFLAACIESEELDDAEALLQVALAAAHGCDPQIGATHFALHTLANVNRPEAWTALCELLLHAGREEGLRSAILQAVANGKPNCQALVLNTTIDENLLRFASVRSLIEDLVGLPFEHDATEASTRRLRTTADALTSYETRQVNMRSDDAETVFLTLRCASRIDQDEFCKLIDIGASANSADVRAEAIRMVTGIALDQRVVSLLINGIADRDERVQAVAVNVLTRMLDERRVHRSAILSDQQFATLRDYCAGLPKAPTTLAPIGVHPGGPKPSHEGTVEVLMMLRADRPTSPLLPLIASLDARARAVFVSRLNKRDLTDTAVREFLFASLASPSKIVRNEAAEKIAWVIPGEPDEREVLSIETALVQSDDWSSLGRAGMVKRLHRQPIEGKLRTIERLWCAQPVKPVAANLAAQYKVALDLLVAVGPTSAQAALTVAKLQAHVASEANLTHAHAQLRALLGETAIPQDALPLLVDLSPGREPRSSQPFYAHHEVGIAIVSRLSELMVASQARFPELYGGYGNEQQIFQISGVSDWWHGRPSDARSVDATDAVHAIHLIEYRYQHGERRPGAHIVSMLGMLVVEHATEQTIELLLDGYESMLEEFRVAIVDLNSLQVKKIGFANRGSEGERLLYRIARTKPDLFTAAHVERWFQLGLWLHRIDPSSLHFSEIVVLAFVLGLTTEDDLRKFIRAGYLTTANCLTQDPERSASVDAILRLHCGTPLFQRARDVLHETVAGALAIELRRSESETSVSALAKVVKHSDIFAMMQIIAEFGVPIFSVNTGWPSKLSRTDVFASIVRHTEPSGISLVEFQTARSIHNVTDEQLVALAIAVPTWIDLVSETLGWDGLTEALWFVRAFVSVDTCTEARSRTVLQQEEIEAGVVDAAWFDRCFESLGAVRWKLIDKWAKLASQEGRCTRFQQAIRVLTGTLTEVDLLKEIDLKRSQNAVANLGLSALPIALRERKAALQNRYQALIEFQEGSKAFGSTKRASEAEAVRVGFHNLAQRAGYGDASRLVWVIESWLDDGKGIKNPSRVRKSLQELMVAGVLMPEDEVIETMAGSVGVDMSTLVWVDEVQTTARRFADTWVSSDGRAVALTGALRIAHPIEMFRSQSWGAWQAAMLSNEIRQSFRQVFRELYLLTDNERGAEQSERYSQHRVKAAQGFALLHAAGWVSGDREDGCTRTFHHDRVRAQIFPMVSTYKLKSAEPFPIGAVEFVSTSNNARLTLESVPPIVFSETMRDLDLVTTVAFAGGAPLDATPSTIDMRGQLVEQIAQLRQLTNVAVDGHYVRVNGLLNCYWVHLGDGVARAEAHLEARPFNVLAVHNFNGQVVLPFVDDDPITAEIVSKVLLLADDSSIRDPWIADQLRAQH